MSGAGACRQGEHPRMRTYDCINYVLLHEEDDQIKLSMTNMLASEWGRFKGPPSASGWTFGSAGRSKTKVEDER